MKGLNDDSTAPKDTIREQLADCRKRLERIEATLDELDKSFKLYRNDKKYDEQEREKVTRT